MKEYPKGGLIGRTVRIAREISSLQIPLHAANTGFFIVLAVFPALLLMLSLLRYTSLNAENLVQLLSGFLPAALMEGTEEFVLSTWQNASGAMVGLSAATALWSASRGLYGLLTGLNAVYGVSESRGYFYTRSISVLYTFLFLLVLLLTLALHVFGSGVHQFLTTVDHPLVIFLVDYINLRFFLLLGLQSLIFTLMYMALPNQRNRFGESLPGGILASLGWLVFSDMFSAYVENFDRYSNIYGSVYAVALGMLWLYFCLSILFFGGLLNRCLKEGKEIL